MEYNWSLKEIYPSFKSEEFISDLQLLDDMIESINQWSNEIIVDKNDLKHKLEEYIKKFTRFTDVASKLNIYVNLVLSVNTNHKEGLKYSDIIEKKLTQIVESNTKIERYISKIEDIDKIINDSRLLKDHEFILKNLIENSKYLLSNKEEKIIANMKNTGSNAWLKLKEKLISNLNVNIEEKGENKELPLTVVLNMAYHKDSSTRKKAYESEIKAYKKVEEGVAASLNGIKGEVLTICDLRGYKSPLDETIKNSRMDEESLNAMLSAMKENLPMFRKYLRRKAEILGYNNGLPFYELYSPINNADMKFTYEEGCKFIIKNFNTFSEHLAKFAEKAINNEWIDVLPKQGKVGGAFCENLHFIGESRFLLNYGESFGDVVTLAHELGHGFHGECLNNETTLNSDYPMPIAETASTFCETIIKKAAIKDANKEEALSILETEISDCTQVIVDIYSRFLFEKSFFEERKESALSVERIKELMLESQRKAYGDGLDSKYLHPYMWIWKPHYYYSDSNFYNFPYAFGLLFAKGLYAEYLKKGTSFASDYEKLLSITGKNKIEDVAKIMNINIHDKDFWISSLKIIEEDINDFMKLSEDLLK